MIQTQPMLEDFGVQRPNGGCGGNGGGGMVGAAPLHHHLNHPHHHHPNHHHHPSHQPHNHQLHHNHHTPGGVYMKPVYNLSSLCHQGPLTPPDKMSPTSQSSSLSPSSAALHHIPVYPHGGGAEPGSGATSNGHATHFRPGQSGLSMPVFPAKRLRGGDHHQHHTEMLRCKRRVDLSLKLGYKTHPTAVARRNERERNRVKHINSTFTTLRQHIPCAAKNKKMSKVETLRSAIRYINHLQQILETQKAEEEGQGDGEQGEEEHGEGVQGQHQRHHHHHIRHLHHPTIHLFSPGGSSSIGSPGADTTSPTTHLDCDVTAVRMRSSVLLSPPGSPTSCDGRPGSADSHDLSPRRHYDYVTAIHDDDDADDIDNDVEEDDDDPHDLSQFGDWF